MGGSSPGPTLKSKMQIDCIAKRSVVVTSSYESLYRENSKVMLGHEPSFNIMNSEILGFLDVLPFSLPELTPSSTIYCCILVGIRWKFASEVELGPFS